MIEVLQIISMILTLAVGLILAVFLGFIVWTSITDKDDYSDGGSDDGSGCIGGC